MLNIFHCPLHESLACTWRCHPCWWRSVKFRLTYILSNSILLAKRHTCTYCDSEPLVLLPLKDVPSNCLLTQARGTEDLIVFLPNIHTSHTGFNIGDHFLFLFFHYLSGKVIYHLKDQWPKIYEDGIPVHATYMFHIFFVPNE